MKPRDNGPIARHRAQKKENVVLEHLGAQPMSTPKGVGDAKRFEEADLNCSAYVTSRHGYEPTGPKGVFHYPPFKPNLDPPGSGHDRGRPPDIS